MRTEDKYEDKRTSAGGVIRGSSRPSVQSRISCIKASSVRGDAEGSIVRDTVSVGGSWSVSMKSGGHEDSRSGRMVQVKVLVSPVWGSEHWMLSTITTDSVTLLAMSLKHHTG